MLRTVGQYYRRLPAPLGSEDVAFAYAAVFRHRLDAPGFALLDLGPDAGSKVLRATMMALREGLEARLDGDILDMLWLGRFDQQATTKFHLDSAADESFLMLGYEPSEVECALYIADFAAWVAHSGAHAATLLQNENPMYENREVELAPFTTALEAFDRRHFQILLLNNSNGLQPDGTLGVMHKAVIPAPDRSKQRVINSMMLCLRPLAQPPQMDDAAVQDWLETEVVLKG